MPNSEETSSPRILVAPGFCWDACAAYLFDIDGTLLRSRDRVHFNAFADGVRRATGREISLDGVPVSGNIDTSILAEACRQAGFSDAFFAENAPAILRAMADSVDEHRDELEPELMPGVEATLAHLNYKGALLGVATGNLEAIGWIKLGRAGLRNWFHFGGFSDRFTVRGQLVASAAEKARELLSNPSASVCVVGDTPRDIEAARSSQLPVIAVATGHYGFDELAALSPTVCASSLADLLAATPPR
ncbi:MAG: HAD family hydrolase [Terracidiphilus sp.]|nr:HAD family hydrolase [Terracidiphilus sp.]